MQHNKQYVAFFELENMSDKELQYLYKTTQNLKQLIN